MILTRTKAASPRAAMAPPGSKVWQMGSADNSSSNASRKRVVPRQLPLTAWRRHYHTGPPAKRRSAHGKSSALPVVPPFFSKVKKLWGSRNATVPFDTPRAAPGSCEAPCQEPFMAKSFVGSRLF